MTEEQIDIIQTSFQSAAKRGDELVDTFYDILFSSAPHLRFMFPADISGQKKKLGSALATTVRLVDQPTNLAPLLQELGARHHTYGVRDEHYKLVGAALIGALERVLGPRFTDDVRAGWIAAFAFVSATMLEGVVTGDEVLVL